MKNKLITISILCLFIIPFISADSIMPGYKTISIKNIITNINEFPNYVFILGGSFKAPSPMYVKVQIVQEGGIIPGSYYKFSSPSVFAIEKDKWDEDLMSEFTSTEDPYLESEDYREFYNRYITTMQSIGAVEVIQNLNNRNQIPESSAITEEVNTYAIDLEQAKVEPDNVQKEREYWKIILYTSISLVALIIITTILVRRKNV